MRYYVNWKYYIWNLSISVCECDKIFVIDEYLKHYTGIEDAADNLAIAYKDEMVNTAAIDI